MLTRKDLENARYPLTLEGKGFRRGSKLILNQIPRFYESGFYGSSIHDKLIRDDGHEFSAFDIHRMYDYWELMEQSYDPNQNGDTEDDV